MIEINLPNFTVTSSAELDEHIAVKAEYQHLPMRCVKCGSFSATFKRHDARDHWYFDHINTGKCVKICVKHRRFKCSECEAIFFERMIGIDERRDMTTRLVDWIANQSIVHKFDVVAHSVGCNINTVRNIFLDMSHREEKAMPMVTPRVLGIDEICLGKKKRDKYRCVVTNIEGGKLIGFLRDRDKPTVIKYFHTLDASAVEVICMDMWPTYRDAARLVFPKAIIVIDRFHIVRMVQNSIEAYRKQLRRDTTGRQRAMLFSDRFTLMSRNIDLDPFKEATLQSWFRLWPEMEHVYDAKERFLDIWLAETKEEAIYLYDAWNNSIPEYVRKYFKDIFTAFSNWSNEIFTYWDYKFTNAFTEGLNSVIRRVYDSGEGYSFEVLRFKLLFTKGTHQLYHKKKPFKARAFDNCTFARTTGATDDTETVSYGVDISTLIEFVNSGKIK